MNQIHIHDMNQIHIHDMNQIHIHDMNQIHIHDMNQIHIYDMNQIHIHDMNQIHMIWIKFIWYESNSYDMNQIHMIWIKSFEDNSFGDTMLRASNAIVWISHWSSHLKTVFMEFQFLWRQFVGNSGS